MSDDKTLRVLAHDLSRLPPAMAGDPFNFINAVVEFLVRWCSAYPDPVKLPSPAYCFFVGFVRVNTAVTPTSGFTRRQYFREDTPSDLLGRCYFCSFECTSVYYRDVDLKNLEDCHTAIAGLQVTGQPFVIFNAAARHISWRLNEHDDLHQAVLRPEPLPRLTSAQLDDTLEDFHWEYTGSPQGLSKPWRSAKKFLTKERLEEEIRDDLYIYLRYLMQEQFAVQREFYGSAGRTDLFIYFHAEREGIYIELKVLRAWIKSGKNRTRVPDEEIIEHGKDGIAQAFNYKRSFRNAGIAYACCFDAREKDSEISELMNFASENDVRYKRYFMYNSAEAQRAATKASGAGRKAGTS